MGRRPFLLAVATAILSCGLLSLAVWQGWLGPDIGRGSGFCEAARSWVVRQPANTFSNMGFVVAGLAIAWQARRPLFVGYAIVVVLLGPASAAMHATQSALGGHLDMLSMYLVASFAAAYAGMRWWKGGPALFGWLFAGGVVFCELAGLWSGEIPVVSYSGNAAFGLLLIVAAVVEVLIMRRGNTHARYAYGYAALGSILTAFLIWNATKTWLCDPHSLIQGHAIWHLLCALAAYLLYRFYASERRPQTTLAGNDLIA